MTVALVGAGPGDPGLITARGLELVRGCNILIHDRLVASELVAEAPADALVVSRDGLVQEELNALLLELGRKYDVVVRLKGGDPFVYGRGGEEALALARAGIDFEIVPGVSALNAVPAAAGIPLTHRGVATEVRVLTGRLAADEPTEPTIVVFMGLEAAADVRDRLLADGVGAATPVAIVASGTMPDQEIAMATLAELAEAAEGLAAPALIVVGEVVALREHLCVRNTLLSTLNQIGSGLRS